MPPESNPNQLYCRPVIVCKWYLYNKLINLHYPCSLKMLNQFYLTTAKCEGFLSCVALSLSSSFSSSSSLFIQAPFWCTTGLWTIYLSWLLLFNMVSTGLLLSSVKLRCFFSLIALSMTNYLVCQHPAVFSLLYLVLSLHYNAKHLIISHIHIYTSDNTDLHMPHLWSFVLLNALW